MCLAELADVALAELLTDLSGIAEPDLVARVDLDADHEHRAGGPLPERGLAEEPEA